MLLLISRLLLSHQLLCLPNNIVLMLANEPQKLLTLTYPLIDFYLASTVRLHLC